MCTAISWRGKHHYFGRNLDLEYHYEEQIVITPRNFPLSFRLQGINSNHYAMIGTATVAQGYPLYYEATNEKGLSMAGLNFPKNAVYQPVSPKKVNIAPFELIPWILSQCSDTNSAYAALQQINLVHLPFSSDLPLSPLHWIISDSQRSITAEPMADGLKIYENPVGVLTNNPPFPYHMQRLSDFMGLSPKQATDHFSPDGFLRPYSNGMGAMGLPGDFSSASRFVKATFVKLNSVSAASDAGDISQFFHMLRCVEMPRGCVIMQDGRYEITMYSSCCDTDMGIYYYATYESNQIHAVNMYNENLDADALIPYPMIQSCTIHPQNQREEQK